MIKGAYIHIPFCEHICYYCDFNKVFIAKQPVDDYLEALDSEMAHYAPGGVETIYIGGGTPTALNDRQFDRLLSSVDARLMDGTIREFTVEANPENLTETKLRLMKNHGVTRLSIGVQSFDDQLLRTIGRAHGAGQAKEAVIRAKKFGFDNISIDLMFALPNQSEASLQQSLRAALELDTSHISIYSLQIEPKTIFFNRMKKGKLPLPGQDMEADMYEMIISNLEKNGFHQYEISNFSKPGYESLHNSLYWKNEEYYGLGAGAHGYIDGRRIVNSGPIKKYIENVRQQGCGALHFHEVTEQERMEEEMFLGLRRLSGVSQSRFYRKFHRRLKSIYGTQIEQLKADGLIFEADDRIALTKKGIFFGNNVFEAFLLS